MSPTGKGTLVKQVMTFHAENECFPLHGDHDLLPEFFLPYVFELSHVMDLEVSLLFPAVLALVGIEPSDDFRTGLHETREVDFDVDLAPVCRGLFKVLQGVST
jgi:hypothetical protein